MRRAARDYDFIDKFIISILEDSPQPLPDLGINLMVNQAVKKTIPIRAVRTRLRLLEEEGKVIRKIENFNGRDVHLFCLK